MPDKLTDNEIIKAFAILDSWARVAYDYSDGTDKESPKLFKAIKCIKKKYNSQRTEIESLEIALTNARDNLGDTRAELNKYETLYDLSLENEKAYKTAIEGWKNKLKTAKAEVERLKNRFMDMERSCHNGRTNGVS